MRTLHDTIDLAVELFAAAPRSLLATGGAPGDVAARYSAPCSNPW